MEDVDKWLECFHWWKFALENPVIGQFDSDDSFCVKWLFQQIVVLLFTLVHELSFFAIIFKFFLNALIVKFFVFIELLFFVEFNFHSFSLLWFQLEDFDISIFDGFRHHFFSSAFFFSQHIIKHNRCFSLHFHFWLVQRNDLLLIRIKGDFLSMFIYFKDTLIQ